MAIDWVESIKILALKEIISKHQSSEFDLRSIARWYSKTFATPLHLVYTLPTYDVLQAYFEETYEELSKSEEGEIELKKIAEELSKSEAEREIAKKEKDKEDVLVHNMEKDCNSNNIKINEKELKDRQKKAKEKIARDKATAKMLEKALDQDSLNSRINLDIPVAPPEEEPQEFKMDFTGLDDIGDLDGLTSLTGVK